MIKASTCKSCGASIYWLKGRTGSNIPVDADPVKDGCFLLVQRRGELVILGFINSKEEFTEWDSDGGKGGLQSFRGRNRYASHFSTCPNADDHRKNK